MGKWVVISIQCLCASKSPCIGGTWNPGHCELRHNHAGRPCVPEYPHRLTAHLKRPTAMRVRGRISHCDTLARAAQRNETSGNAGDCLPSPASTIKLLFEPGAVGTFVFLRGRCEEGVEAIARQIGGRSPQCHESEAKFHTSVAGAAFSQSRDSRTRIHLNTVYQSRTPRQPGTRPGSTYIRR